jgi:hypothetical protein
MVRLWSGRSSYSDYWSLHTAGPDSPDSATRLHLRGTAAIGSGPGWSRRSGAGQSGMERVDGGDCSEPSRTGLDQDVAL